MDYATRFHRYNRNTCEGRISGIIWFNTNDGFGAAIKNAETLLAGMRAVDPDVDYDILEIVGRGVHSPECGSGGRIWETTEEFEARIDKPKSKP